MTEATGVFVNINGDDSAQWGGASNPCQTVQGGLNQVKVLGKTTVYETYRISLLPSSWPWADASSSASHGRRRVPWPRTRSPIES